MKFIVSLFRSVLVKYSDRGLADDVFWFNGNMKLFENLFWILNLTLLLLAQTVWLAGSLQQDIDIDPRIHR